MGFWAHGLALACGGFMFTVLYSSGGASASVWSDVPGVPRALTQPSHGMRFVAALAGKDDVAKTPGRAARISAEPGWSGEGPVARLELAQRERSRSVVITPPGAVPRVPGSRTIRRSGTYRGQPGSVAVTVTPDRNVVEAEASGGFVEFRRWGVYWDEFWKRRDKCREEYKKHQDKKKLEKCIDDALLETLGDLVAGTYG